MNIFEKIKRMFKPNDDIFDRLPKEDALQHKRNMSNVNGVEYDIPKGASVKIVNDKVYINGKLANPNNAGEDVLERPIILKGDVENLHVENGDVYSEAYVTKSMYVNGNATIFGDIQSITDDLVLTVDGDMTVHGKVEIDEIKVYGDFDVNADIYGDVTAHGDVKCGNVDGSVHCNGDVDCLEVKHHVNAKGDVIVAYKVHGEVRNYS